MRHETWSNRRGRVWTPYARCNTFGTMPICPYCETQTETPLTPCPSGDGFYTIDEEDWRACRGEPLLGWPVAGRFVVTNLIGRGSMARVFRARQIQLNRDVALKLFDSAALQHELLPQGDRAEAIEIAKERFEREAQVLAQISHPNCVTLYDYGVSADGRFLFIAMEFVQGLSLRQAVNRGLKFGAIVEIAQQVLLALREAHALGIVHRDLKPENIILSVRFGTEEQVVKVVDFGIAKMLTNTEESRTMVGMLFGTPAYMSPEQCRGETETVTKASDIYALGCVLFELVTGRLPFNATTPQEMVRMHLECPPPEAIARHGMEIPETFKGFLKTCMQKDPAARFPDAHAALVALDEIVGSTPGLSSTSGYMRRRAAASQPSGSKVVVPKDQIRGDQIAPPSRETAAAVSATVPKRSQQSQDPTLGITDTHPPGTLPSLHANAKLTAVLVVGFIAVILFCVVLLYFIWFRIVGP